MPAGAAAADSLPAAVVLVVVWRFLAVEPLAPSAAASVAASAGVFKLTDDACSESDVPNDAPVHAKMHVATARKHDPPVLVVLAAGVPGP